MKNEIQNGTAFPWGEMFLKFDSEKRPFLLPFGSRLIRIGCEQFKLYQLVPALQYPPTRIQRKNSPKGICTNDIWNKEQ
jgi:hypothetical protein